MIYVVSDDVTNNDRLGDFGGSSFLLCLMVLMNRAAIIILDCSWWHASISAFSLHRDHDSQVRLYRHVQWEALIRRRLKIENINKHNKCHVSISIASNNKTHSLTSLWADPALNFATIHRLLYPDWRGYSPLVQSPWAYRQALSSSARLAISYNDLTSPFHSFELNLTTGSCRRVKKKLC